MALSMLSFGFGQTIATIDRDNIVGPTATSTLANMSSIGLTRGSGVTQSTASTNFNSRNWPIGGDQVAAAAGNYYIQWSISANTAFEITLDELDISLRRNANGPTTWQIFYSLDNFATIGTALDTPQTLASLTTTPHNTSGLTITSGVSGTISFRLYAWGATTNEGWLRVIGETAWASPLAITNPGVRISGSVSTTSTNSFDSDIVASTFVLLPTQQNIDYNSSYITPSGLNFSNSVPLGAFTIRDGGIGSDTDTDGTTLTSIDFAVTNSENLAALAIIDLGTFAAVAEVTTVNPTTTLDGFSVTAADGGTRQFVVLASFKSVVTDNEQIQLTITSANAPAVGSSLFSSYNAGGAQTSIVGDDNRIEVIASKFEFTQQPTDGNQNEVIVPFPIINAVDVNSNLDLDANITGISLTTSPTAGIVAETYDMINGEATLDNIVFTETVTGVSIVASSTGISGTSNAFNINGPLISIAGQNFDSATDWTYTSNRAYFGTVSDWGGTVGYFGEIALSNAAPLDNPLFDNEIFGESDLNDISNPFAILTFANTDVSTYSDISIEFDWQVNGYVNIANDIQYRLFLNGSASGAWVAVFDGNGDINDATGRVKISIPNGNSTVGLQVRLRNNRDNGYSGFDNFRLVREFSGLIYTASNGWKDNISPDATTGALDAIVIDGTYDVSGNIQLENLFINEGATTVLDFGESITTNSNVINNGNLELNSISNSYSSLIVNGTITNEVTYNRHVNQFADTGATTGKNDLISAPVTNSAQTFSALRTANTQIPSGTIGGVPSYLFGPFDIDNDEYINYTAADDASVVTSGIGYRTASTDVDGSSFKFVGDVETGTKSVAINVGSGSIQNLIGNPYPSYIQLSTFLTENGTEFNPTRYGVYGYKGDVTTGFAVWNQAYSDANPTAKLTPGQGFFVASKSGGATINFTPAMRTTGTSDDFIVGRSENQNLANLSLQIEKEGNKYTTDLYFNDNASLSMDPGYDSEMFETNAPAFSIYSHLVQDNLGKNMAAQSVSFSDLENVTIPLGINIEQGVQGTVSISESFIPEGIEATLEDNVNNTFTNLLESNYVFTPSTSLTDTGRFYLHFTTEATLSNSDNLLNGLEIYAISKTITIKGLLESDTMFNLYDVQGRLVNSNELNSRNTQNSVDVSNLSAGIYVVQLQNNAGTRTQKVIIK